ncbi:cyclase family protein [Egibacter rhizosphaerae]|uniref:cyclase family protein n=1 Tax=Egibacter rhizosphaerae TaxID=1670831 RepID=UPI0013F15495|nr:cyclase family protein [Egibacter rhizosphaerae]
MRIVDLTLPFGPGTPSPPSAGIDVKMESFHKGPGFWQASKVEMLLHTGSHVDFARHCVRNGETAADVALDRASGEALVIDLSHVGPDHGISPQDLELAAPPLREGDIALIRTDWSDQAWGDFPRYFLESPYCEPDAAQWLLDRGAKAVGFDCFSEVAARRPDFTSEEFIIHKIVLEPGAILMQHLTNLSALPQGVRVPFYCTWPKMAEAEGAPARFFALLDH